MSTVVSEVQQRLELECKKFKLPSSSPLLIIGMRNSFFSFPNCFTMARVITPLKTWTNGYNIEPPEPLRMFMVNPYYTALAEKKTREIDDWVCSQTALTVTCGNNWIHLRSNLSVIKCHKTNLRIFWFDLSYICGSRRHWQYNKYIKISHFTWLKWNNAIKKSIMFGQQG